MRHLNYVFCRAKQDANKNRLYVHEVFVSDKIKKGDTLQTAASKPHGGISLYRDILANVLETVAKTEPQQSTNAVSDDSLRSTKTIDGINSEEPNGKSTVSNGKDTTKSSNSQENQQKTDEKVEEHQNEEVQGGALSNKEVYNRHTTTKQSAETAEASQDVEQGDTQTPSSMNAPTPSEGKDTTKSPNPQENQQKTDKKVKEPQNEEVQGDTQGVGQIWEESSRWNTLSEEDAKMLIQNMEDSSEDYVETELSPESWNNSFDEDNSIETPIGRVKMGGNQISKFLQKKRTKEFGMVAPTLSNPDVIVEEKSEAKDGNSERQSSYIFIKTFNRNGEKIKFYASITVKKDGREVSISSHYMNRNAVEKRLMEDNVIYIKD